jgi:hypothetical protein
LPDEGDFGSRGSANPMREVIYAAVPYVIFGLILGSDLPFPPLATWLPALIAQCDNDYITVSM